MRATPRLIGLTALCVAALAMTPSALLGGILFVDDDAPPGGDGQSWATAYTYLQDALTAARNSGGAVTEIWVAAGTYRPDQSAATPGGTGSYASSFILTSNLALRGGFAGNEDPATFDLAGRDLNANTTTLSGHLAGGGRSSGVVGRWSPAVTNAVIDGFTVTGSYEYGMWLSGSWTVANCRVTNNDNYGIHSIGTLVMRRCTVQSNKCQWIDSAGVLSSGVLDAANCVISDNDGYAIYLAGTAALTNCTITSFSIGICMASGTTVTLTNSIHWAWRSTSGTLTARYSCVKGGMAGEGNISEDPRIISTENPRLRRGSPCIDAGDNAAVPPDVSTDWRGMARRIDDPDTPDTGAAGGLSGGLVDIGACEYEPVPAERLYVKAAAEAGGDGSSWTTPYRYLQDALAAAAERPGVTEIWVAQGTYRPDQGAGRVSGDQQAYFRLQGGLALYGGFPGEVGQEGDMTRRRPWSYPSILSGDLAGDDGPDFLDISENSLRLLSSWFTGGPGTILDGMTVTGAGNGEYFSGAMRIDGSSPVVRNCVFRGCYGRPAVIECYQTPANFVNCVFDRNNNALSGGATVLTLSGGGEVTNCTFIISPRQTASAINSNYQYYTWVRNCIFFRGPQLARLSGCLVTFSYSATWLTDAPLFLDMAAGDLRLHPDSPCIDAGSNAAVPDGTLTDAGGNLRFFDAPGTPDCASAPGTCGDAPIVDMGAYEYIPPIPGDLEGDGDVDADDFAAFKACASGAAVALGAGCDIADLDADEDADMDDFGIFQRCYSGAGKAAAPACGD